MKPRVWNLHDPNCPDDAVLIDRTTKYGNPFKVGRQGTRDQVISKYREYVISRPWMIRKIKHDLKGRHLKCHCKPKACHGDVLLEIANTPKDK